MCPRDLHFDIPDIKREGDIHVAGPGIEHPEKYNWWLNELESLGVNTLEKHGLNNPQEVRVMKRRKYQYLSITPNIEPNNGSPRKLFENK